MRSNGLRYLLMLLIVVQSVMAVADSHRIPQNGVQTIALDRLMDISEGTSAKDSSDQKQAASESDSNHCCHSYCCYIHALSEALNTAFKNEDQLLIDHVQPIVDPPYFSLLRPPKI